MYDYAVFQRMRRPVIALTIAVVGMAACYACSGPRTSPSPSAEPARLPNTPAGRCASAWFDAFNSGDADTMTAFEEEQRPSSYLAEFPTDRRRQNYERLRGIFGEVSPLRVVLSLDLQLTLLADATETDDILVVRFQLTDASPHRLDYLRFSGIDDAQVPDDYVVSVANRAAPLDGPVRNEAVRSVARVFRDSYVDPDVGKAMADTLLAHLSAGAFAKVRTTGQLADIVTEDAVAVSGDKHVWLAAVNPLQVQSTYAENAPVETLRKANYHFRKVAVLPGNVGYIKFDMIHDDKEPLVIAAAAMDSVKGCDALIFDLRDNIGGEWGSGRLILSYLLPKSTILSRVYDRDGRLVRTDSTLATLPGKRIDDDVPVYVLTSNRTGSAGEAFTFLLQQSGRATVVGETTLGMGYQCQEVPIEPYFVLSVSTLKVINSFTNSSFQGSGVAPDIRVDSEDALDTALKDAKSRRRVPTR